MEEIEHIYIEDLIKLLQDLGMINRINSILDIGCGVPILLFALKHHYGIKKCVGVDKLNQEKFSHIIYKGVNYSVTVGNNNKDSIVFNIYKKYCEAHDIAQPIPKSEFYEKEFNLIYGKEIIKYFEESDSSFDLIVVSKLISHLEIDYITFLNQCMDKLNKNGRIILRLNSEDWETCEVIKQNFNDEKVAEICKIINCIWGPKKEKSKGDENSLQYLLIGSK